MTAATSRSRPVTSPPRLAARCADSCPLVILQRHHDTPKHDAVLSARLEENRLKDRTREKAKQLAASQRRTRQRVKVYRALSKQLAQLRCGNEPNSGVDPLAVRNPFRVASRPKSRGQRAGADGEFDTEVMCAVNPHFVASPQLGEAKSSNTQAKFSARRRLQCARNGSVTTAFSVASAPCGDPGGDEKENEERDALEEEDDDLTQVTWEYLPDTQRTEASDLFIPSVRSKAAEGEGTEGVPPLLLTPGRSSQPPSTTSSIPRSARSVCSVVQKSARSLDLYFYPKLVAADSAKAADSLDERRPLTLRRIFADMERENARRTRQQRHAERQASRLKNSAESRRLELEAASRSKEVMRPACLAPPKATELACSPPRAFTAARSFLRERLDARGLSVCPCADEEEEGVCAENCPFFGDEEGYLRALRSILPEEKEK